MQMELIYTCMLKSRIVYPIKAEAIKSIYLSILSFLYRLVIADEELS